MDDGEHIASWVDPATVVAVSEALANLDEAKFAEQYRTRLPPDYALDHGEEDLGYTWDWFQEVRDLYARAAREGLAVVFTVSL